MSEATTESTQAQATPDAAVINTGAGDDSGTGTQPETAAQPTERTFTQADVDRIVQTRLKSAVKAELKKLASDGEGAATVEDLQRQLTDATNKARTYEASAAIRDYVTDPKHKFNVKAENLRAVEKLVINEIEYDDDGKPSNLKEAIESVKNLAPALFAQTNVNINQGKANTFSAANMNDFIRQAHAGR